MVTIYQGLDAPAVKDRNQRLYFAVWRWHFYAAIYVIPFILMLAASGLIILWVTAISPEYGDRMYVTPGAKPLMLSEQETAAIAAHPGGTVDKYIAPIDAAKPAIFRVQTDDGAMMVALDPYTGKVVNDRPEDGTWNAWATSLHGQLLTGVDKGWADYMVETAASLGILMVVTGLWMAWPRNGEGFSAMFIPRLSAKGRAFWKSTHRAVGSWMGIVLMFFLISGLAWAGVWGGRLVQTWSSFPAEKWDAPLSDKTEASLNHTAVKDVPWALELTPLPMSGSMVGKQVLPEGTPVILQTVVEEARALGFTGRMQVTKPDGDKGVWTISQDSMSYDSPDPMSDRTVHLDQYTGKVLADVRYADYSPMAKSMAVGVALHEGQLGPLNIALNIAYCLSVMFLCVGGVAMWWIRRPSKALRLVAPPAPEQVPLTGWVIFFAIVLSLAVPVLGITLIAIIAIDQIVLSSLPVLKRLVS